MRRSSGGPVGFEVQVLEALRFEPHAVPGGADRDRFAIDVGDVELLRHLAPSIAEDQGEHTAARSALEDARESSSGFVVEVRGEVRDDEESIRLRDLTRGEVVRVDRFELVPQVLLDHRLHVFGDVGELLFDLARFGPDAFAHQARQFVLEVHEAREVLAEADRIEDRETSLARGHRREDAEHRGAEEFEPLGAVVGVDVDLQARPGRKGDHRRQIEGRRMIGGESGIHRRSAFDGGAIEPEPAQGDRGRGDAGGRPGLPTRVREVGEPVGEVVADLGQSTDVPIEAFEPAAFERGPAILGDDLQRLDGGVMTIVFGGQRGGVGFDGVALHRVGFGFRGGRRDLQRRVRFGLLDRHPPLEFRDAFLRLREILRDDRLVLRLGLRGLPVPGGDQPGLEPGHLLAGLGLRSFGRLAHQGRRSGEGTPRPDHRPSGEHVEDREDRHEGEESVEPAFDERSAFGGTGRRGDAHARAEEGGERKHHDRAAEEAGQREAAERLRRLGGGAELELHHDLGLRLDLPEIGGVEFGGPRHGLLVAPRLPHHSRLEFLEPRDVLVDLHRPFLELPGRPLLVRLVHRVGEPDRLFEGLLRLAFVLVGLASDPHRHRLGLLIDLEMSFFVGPLRGRDAFDPVATGGFDGVGPRRLDGLERLRVVPILGLPVPGGVRGRGEALRRAVAGELVEATSRRTEVTEKIGGAGHGDVGIGLEITHRSIVSTVASCLGEFAFEVFHRGRRGLDPPVEGTKSTFLEGPAHRIPPDLVDLHPRDHQVLVLALDATPGAGDAHADSSRSFDSSGAFVSGPVPVPARRIDGVASTGSSGVSSF